MPTINFTSPSWWLNMFITTLVTIFFIYLIKQVNKKVAIPVVQDVINEA